MDDYKINFGFIARTIDYQDAQGELCFTFDIEPAQDAVTGKWVLHLDNPSALEPSRAKSASEQLRIALITKRVEEYLENKGYRVQVT